MDKHSQFYISGPYIRSVQVAPTPSQVKPIPSNLLPFFIKKAAADYLGEVKNTKGLQESLTLFSKDRIIPVEGQVELLPELTTAIKTKTLTFIEAEGGKLVEDKTASTQYLGDFEKFEPLYIRDINLHSDVNEIIRDLKTPPADPYFFSLFGKASGPKDLSINKRKYLAQNTKSSE